MNAATEGDKAAAASDWSEAIKQYTKALIELPRAPGYWIKRSTSYSRRKSDGGPDFKAALRDAELALALARERGKRELIIEAQMRRAIVLFQLEQYGNSGFLFDILAEKLGLGKEKHEDRSAQVQAAMSQKGSQKQENELSIWKIKIQGRLNKLEKDDQRLVVTISEYPDIKIPSEQELRRSLQAQLTTSATSGIVEELPESTSTTEKTKETKLDVAGPGSSAPFTAGPGAPPAAPSAPAAPKVRHEWYQSHDSVVVTVYAKNVSKDQLETELQEDSVSLEFPLSTGSSFSFNLDPLYALIDPAQSKVNVFSTKIEVVLRKQAPGQKWGSLEGSALATSKPISAPMTQISQASTTPSYPTSSKHGVKNWDKLATDLTKKKEKNKDDKAKKSASKDKDGADQEAGSDSDVDSEYGGGDAVDSFFKKLYANSDPDTQRAMMKSYYESQGTALSTNWDEVAKDKVAVHPPSSD